MTKAEIIAEAIAAKKSYLLREAGAGGRVYKIKRIINTLPEADRIEVSKIYCETHA